MTEYGMAIITRGPEELQPDVLLSVHRTLQANFDRTKQAHPEYGLGDQWDFRVGPMTMACEWEECPLCGGEESQGCDVCEGAGGWPGDVIPGVYDHAFGWYVNTDEETP